MPAVGPQGSRGGLITAVVVFTILFVTATIFAIYFGVDDNKKTDALATQAARTKDIYSAQVLVSPQYKNIKPSKPGQTVLEASFQNTQELAELLNGKTATSGAQPMLAAEEARKALTDAAAKLPSLNLSQNLSIVSALNKVVAYANDQQYQVAALHRAQFEAAGDAAKQIMLAQQMTESAKKDGDKANKMMQNAMDLTQKAQADYVLKTRQMSQDMDGERKQFNAQLQELQQKADTKDKELTEEKRLAEAMNDKLANRRQPIDPILRQPDGVITSVANSDVCYISLGLGDHIMAGMTFEVYNRRDGIPKQDDLMSPEGLPVGVGSIEVEHVEPSLSQCRIIKTEVGQHINEGDLIANLVYDRNTKYNFVVYGDFDLGQTGTPRKGDDKKIMALVTEWGGHIQKDINVDTDFVVMGAVPEVHTFSADDLNDPLNRVLQDEQKAKYNAYDAELTKAKELHIPIMNQNRFLYFCGYYDNAQR